MGDVSVGAVNAKVGADVSGYVAAMVDAASATKNLGDTSKVTAAEVIELMKAGEAGQAKLEQLWQQANELAEGYAKWTEAQQRAAMAMSGMQDQANKMNEALSESTDTAGDFGAELLKMVGLGAAAGGGIALVAAALEVLKGATIGAIESFVAFGHSIELVHIKLGVSLEDAAAWQQSAGMTGVAAEQMASSLAMMDTRLATGNKQAIDAINKLGLSFAELRDAAPDKQVDLLSEAFQRLEGSGLKVDAIFKELGGRGFLSMLPAFTHDAEDLRDKLKETNGPLKEQAELAERYEKSVAELGASWDKVYRTLAQPVIGPLAKIMEAIARSQGSGGFGLAGTIAGLALPPGDGVRRGVGTDTPGPPAWSGENINVVATQADLDRADRAGRAADKHELVEITRQEAIEQRNLTEARKAFDAVEKDLTVSENALKEAEAGEESTLAQRIQKVRDHAEVQKASAEVAYDHAVALGVDKDAMRADTDETKANIDAATDLTVKKLEDTDATKDANDYAKVSLAVDAELNKAEGDLAKARGDHNDAIDAATHKAVLHIEKLKEEIDADQRLTPEQKELLKARLDDAEATEKQTEAQKKHIESLTEMDSVAHHILQTLTNLGVDGSSFVMQLANAFVVGADAALQMAKATSSTEKAMIAVQTAATIYTGGTQTHSGAGAFASGAVSGAAAGAAFGPYGVAIGAVVGGVIGLIGYLHRPEYMKAMEDVGKSWGVAIQEGLAKQIAATETKDNISRTLAELLNVGDIMSESGRDPSTFTGKINDLMNAVAMGVVPAKEGVDALGKAFDQLRTAAESGSLASEEAMIAMIQRSRELGESIPEISAFVLDTLQKVAQALPTYFAGFGTAPGAQVSGANAQILGASFQSLAAQEGVTKAAADLTAAFNQLTAGMPKDMALPANLANLATMVDLLKDADFKAVADASQAGSQAMQGLEETGYLSQETTNAFQVGAIALQKQAVQVAIDHGYSPDAARVAGEEANLPLLAQLQHAQDMGATLSPEAQAMLTQAQADGVLPLKSVADQQLLALHQIARNTGRDISDTSPPGPGGTAGTGGGTAPGTGPPNNRYPHPGPGGHYGYAAGGFVPATAGGQHAIVGEGGEGEWIIPQSKMGGNTYVKVYVGQREVRDIVVEAVTDGLSGGGALLSPVRRAVTGRP